MASTAVQPAHEPRNGSSLRVDWKTLILFGAQVVGAVYAYGQLNERVAELQVQVHEVRQELMMIRTGR